MICEKEPCGTAGIEIEGSVFHLLFLRQDWLSIDAPGSVEILRPGNPDGAKDRPVGGGTEEHQEKTPGGDDLSRTRRGRIVCAGSRMKRHDVVAFPPGAPWRSALSLHGKIGKS